MNGVMRNDCSEESDLGDFEFAFVETEEELFSTTDLQESAYVLSMFFDRGVVQIAIVHIYLEDQFADKFLENVVHQLLECSRGIAQAKEHNEGFEETELGEEGSFPLVSLLDANIVEAPADVKFRENLGSTHSVKNIVNSRKGILVSDCVRVEPSVVLNGAFFSVLFGNKEEGGSVGGSRGANSSGRKVVVKEFSYSFLLRRRKGDDFLRRDGWCIRFQIYCVIKS